MSNTIKGFRGKDGPILLDYGGVANIPGAVKSITELEAAVGDHFEVASVDDSGRVATVKAVAKPTGGGELPADPTFGSLQLGGETSVSLYPEGTATAPALTLYGANGGGPVQLNNVADATDDRSVPNLGQVKRLIGSGEDSGQNLNLDTTLTKSGEAADAKAAGDEIKRVERLIPSIEGLAKTEDIPTRPEDIGAQPKGNYLTTAPVESVNGKTGKVTLSASDVGADPEGTAAAAVSAHNTNNEAHPDIRLEIKAIREQLAAFLDVDEETLNELSELIAAIAANQTSITQLTTGKVNVTDIIDNLTTNVANKPLSAAQGVVIKGLIDRLSSGKLDASKLTEAVNNALAQAKANGEFDGAKGDPGRGIKSIARTSGNGVAGTTDTYTITYTDNTTSTFTVRNGSNGADGVSPTVAVSKSGKVTTITITDKNGTKTATINDGADGSSSVADGSITPEKTSFIVCEGTGETESTLVPNFTNLADPTSSDWNTDTRFSTSKGTMSECAGAIVTNTVYPVYAGDTVCIKGIKGGSGDTASAYFQIVGYTDEAGTEKCSSTGLLVEKTTAGSGNGIADIVTVEDGVTTWTAYTYVSPDDGTPVQSIGFTGAVALRIGGVPVTTVDDIIITVNEPITYTEVTSGGKSYTLDEKIIVPRANGLRSGARWFALGDSITEGWTSAVDSSASNGYKQFLNANEAERWVNIVAEKNGYILTNYGVGGTGYAHHTSGNVNARAQVANIDFSQCDMVTLAFGVNDWKGKATLGSMDDDVDTVDAFVPNMRYVIKKILSDNPYCKIFVITPINCRSLGDYARNWGIGYDNAEHASGPGLEQIYQLEKTVCEFHGIELIDMTHSSIINRENIRTMLADYVHPTVECHAVLGRELARKIKFI